MNVPIVLVVQIETDTTNKLEQSWTVYQVHFNKKFTLAVHSHPVTLQLLLQEVILFAILFGALDNSIAPTTSQAL